jgi:transcription termination factor Rho
MTKQLSKNGTRRGQLEIAVDNYDFVNVNRTTKSGGGVDIYVTNELKYKIRFD